MQTGTDQLWTHVDKTLCSSSEKNALSNTLTHNIQNDMYICISISPSSHTNTHKFIHLSQLSISSFG